MSNPKVSVIVPVYNAEKYLPRCINSILAQTYDNIEIIIVNDGSSDSSSTLIDDLAKNNSSVKAYHQSNKGTAETRRAGMNYATGDYISFVDADDWLPSDSIDKLYKKCIEYNLDYAIGYPDVFFSKERILPSHRPYPGIYDSNEFLKIIMKVDGGVPNWGSLSKRDLWDDSLFPPRETSLPGEDFLINIKLSAKIKRAGIFNDIMVYYYFLNPQSLTSVGTLYKQELWELAITDIRNFIKAQNKEREFEIPIRIIEINRLAFHVHRIDTSSKWIKRIYSYERNLFPLKYKILHTLIRHPYICSRAIHYFHKIKGWITRSKRQSYLFKQ